ncbi:LacI family DNA-binding transcriptional regulator [Brevibacterium sp. FME37]|uniref:LacI family DNA-binding transcriptional regulator n=1 Tax=Brevibacterium sp. FME37 TaxID=2742607 RepID=UPI0018692C06|nr:LacI family DNA-binding transcriptional regulator [Brevibacterium sp. FME37]
MAKAAGVSPSLVSFVFNERPGVSETTREHVLKVAAELGYQPDPLARELRTGKATTMGLVVRNVANPFFNEILMGMQDQAERDGVSILAMDARYDPAREEAHLRSLAARRPAGLALVPVGDASSVRLWQQLCPESPLVVVNATLGAAPEIPHVTPDDVSAVRLAFNHLHGLGHRRIALLSAPPELMPDRDRTAEYLSLCAHHELPAFPIYASLRGDGLIKHLKMVLSAPNSERPTAVITNSDHTAALVYHATRQLGLSVGHDVSVVGHDDLPTSALLSPGLSTISVNLREMGRQAYLRIAVPGLGNHREPVTLLVRGSTGPPAQQE